MPARPRLLCLALASIFALSPSLAQAADAAGAFKAKHEAVVELVEQGAGDTKLGQAIDGMLDYGWLAQSSLGGADNYAKVCGSRCAEFEALLTQLIRTSYVRMARQAASHPIELVSQVEGKGGVHKVTTKMKVDRNGRQRNMTVEYVMHHVDGVWQIRDIITDDVSLVKTYRHEFHKIAKADGIDGIIVKLEAKLAKVDADAEDFFGDDG